MENPNSLLSCCGALKHPWDTFSVSTQWLPERLRCIIIGESPGEDTTRYYYNPLRKVPVRTIMLRELARHGLITEPTLLAFKKSGFLFDHAIRCILPSKTILQEANLASRYASPRASAAKHLAPFLEQLCSIWVMGRIARNSVAEICCDFPRDSSEISKPPYPCVIPEASRFFVSRYLLHASHVELGKIFSCFHSFLNEKTASRCAACFNMN